MVFSKEDYIRRAKAYTGLKLMEDIKDIYQDLEMPISDKKIERARLTKEFIEECIKMFGLSKEEITRIVDETIKSERWVQEIEELEETELNDREELE